MHTTTEFRETQVFCTASHESPEYVNVSLTIQAASLEAAEARAQSIPCQLEVNERGFTLIRAGVRHSLSESDISFENTGAAARERLRQHGSPFRSTPAGSPARNFMTGFARLTTSHIPSKSSLNEGGWVTQSDRMTCDGRGADRELGPSVRPFHGLTPTGAAPPN